MPSVLTRLRGLAHALGWTCACAYVVSRILSAASGNRMRLVIYRLVAQPVSLTEPAFVSRPSTLSIRQTDASEAFAFFAPRPAHVLRRRFAQGSRCFVALQDGRFRGFAWVGGRVFDEDEVRCRYVLPDAVPAVWDFDVHIEPDARGTRLFARLWHAVHTTLAREGVRVSYSRISAFNAASLAAHRRLGMRPLATALFLCLGRLQICFASIAPWVHVGFRRGPIFHLPVT